MLPCGARAFVSALLCSTGEHESEPKGVRCSPFCGSVVVRGCLMFLFVLERDYLGAVVLSRELRMAVLWSWACTQGQPDQGASTVLRFVYWSGLEGKLLVVQPRRAPRWGQGEEAIPTHRHVQPRNVKEQLFTRIHDGAEWQWSF